MSIINPLPRVHGRRVMKKFYVIIQPTQNKVNNKSPINRRMIGGKEKTIQSYDIIQLIEKNVNIKIPLPQVLK